MRKVLAILFLFCQFAAFSQILNFKDYSLEEGLSNSDVNCIIQDDRGFLWIGTRGGGVNVFDGHEFKAFSKEDGLAGNEVRSLLQDSKGNIWIGTNDGLSYFDGLKFHLINSETGLVGTNVLCLYEHTDGSIWAGTDDGGLNKITTGAEGLSIVHYDQTNGLSNNFIFDITAGPNGSIWLATFYGGIDMLELQDDSIDVTWLKGNVDIPSELIITLESDGKDGYWVGSYDRGVFHIYYDQSTEDYRVDELYDVTSEIGDNTIWDLHLDDDGGLWIATNSQGLSRLVGQSVISYTEQNGLPNNQLLSLVTDNEGNLWIGTNGNGIAQFRGDHYVHLTEASEFELEQVYCTRQLSDGRLVLASYGSGLAIQKNRTQLDFDYLNNTNGLPGNFISSITIDQNDQIWAATENGVVRFDGEYLDTYTEQSGLLNNVVNVILADDYDVVWCGTKFGLSAISGDRIFNLTAEEGLIDNTITDIIQDSRGNIWFATLGGLARYDRENLQNYDEEEGLAYKRLNTLCEGPNGDIWISTNGDGLYKLEVDSEDSLFIKKMNIEGLSSSSYKDIQFANDSTLIAGFNRGFDKIVFNEDGRPKSISSYGKEDGFIGVETNFNAIYASNDGFIWFGTPLGATRYDINAEPVVKTKPRVHIDGLKLFYEEVDWLGRGDVLEQWTTLPSNLELNHRERQLTFEYTGIFMSNPSQLRYSHFLEGADATWSPAQAETQITYPGLSPGKYAFKVVAIDGAGRRSDPATFTFVIKPPWYQTPLFYIISVVVLILLIYSFIRYREMKLKEEKEHLEKVVAERTAEVVEQKEIIEHKNKDITDSINYARRIQEAMLPNMDELDGLFKEAMILFMPKDIVSGDFFWFAERNGKVFFTASDCTGHGVPGAFMSMIGASLLNDSVNEKLLDSPSEILDNVRQRIITSLGQTGAEGQQKDGMDMALCAFSYDDHILQFSGANNALYVLRKSGNPLTTISGEELEPWEEQDGVALFEVKANKMPVGYYSGGQIPFELHQFKTEPGDVVYTFSDGYPDQFGGPKGKKFKYAALKRKLIYIFDLPLEEQKSNLHMTIMDWMGEEEQIDDICFVAVRI